MLLADGRFPAGGHAHSGGVEVAVSRGRVVDVATLVEFLEGRLATAALVESALAAATCHRAQAGPWAALVAEAEARQPSPALRSAWRAQGRALLRAGRRAWPGPMLDGLARAAPDGPPHPVAVGACAAAAGLTPAHTSAVVAYQAVAGPAAAAVRLLALDPLATTAALAALAPEIDRVADRAATVATASLGDLPAASAPLLDLGAEDHAAWEVRLFAS